MSRSFLALLLVFHLSLFTLNASASDNNPTFDSLLRTLDQIGKNHPDTNRKDGLPSTPVPKEKIPKKCDLDCEGGFDDLYRKFNEKKEHELSLAELRYSRLYENAKKQAKNAESELKSAKSEEESIKADLEKFEEISNSPFENEFKTKAWDALRQKYPTLFTELNVGEIQAVKNKVKFYVKSKRKELESQQNFVEYLVNNKEKVVQKLYKETQHSNDSSLEESLRSSMETEEPGLAEVDLLKELEQLAKMDVSPMLLPDMGKETPETAESPQKSDEFYDSILEKLDSFSVESEPVKVEVSRARLDSSSFQSKLRTLSKASQATTELGTGNSYVFAKKGGTPGADVRSLYVGLIQEKIYKNWREPLAEEHNRETVVSFYIFPRGNIDKPFIKKSSGVEGLDTLAVRAILDSVPFPEFPKKLKISNLHVNIYFKYVPKDE